MRIRNGSQHKEEGTPTAIIFIVPRTEVNCTEDVFRPPRIYPKGAAKVAPPLFAPLSQGRGAGLGATLTVEPSSLYAISSTSGGSSTTLTSGSTPPTSGVSLPRRSLLPVPCRAHQLLPVPLLPAQPLPV